MGLLWTLGKVPIYIIVLGILMKKTILKQTIFHATNHMNLNIFANTEGVTSIFVIPLMVVKGIEMNCQIVEKTSCIT